MLVMKMLYSHSEIKKIYKTTYQIRKAISNKKIYKIEKGIYSDNPEVHHLEVLMKKYSYAIITGESAYYYYNLTDIIPSKLFLATRDSNTRIHDKEIKQIRMKDSIYKLGKTEIVYEGVTINIYDKERLLIDLARNKNRIGYDLYKEIISNYRKITDQLDISKIEHYLQYFNNSDKIFEILQDEVF